MPIWISFVFTQGILALAGCTDSSKFVRRRSGSDAKDAYYLSNQYSPDGHYEYHRIRTHINHDYPGPRPHDNGQEPSIKTELFVQPGFAEDYSKINQLKKEQVPPRLAAILPLVKFNCQNHIEGYYADIDFGCTVFHYCTIDKVRHTFMCLGDRKFNEKYLICEYQQATNCSKAFSDAVEAERIRRWNLNSRVDNFSEYDELPELIRTKRIGNDFAVSDIFNRWDDKYDPLRFKRSARAKRYADDSSEDLLAMSSEPAEQQADSLDFADRAGNFFTDNQWRSAGINLDNRRRSFSPYQAPRQAVQQNRQALHSFRQENKNTGNEPYRRANTEVSPPFQDHGNFEAPSREQEFFRPQREISSQKPTKIKKYIEDDEAYGNVFDSYEKHSPYPNQGNYRPNTQLVQPPNKPKQSFAPQQPSGFGQPFPFENFFNPPEQRPRLQPPPPPKQSVSNTPEDQYLEPTQAPYEEPQPKPKKKQKKRPQYEQYDEYAAPPSQAESPKPKEVFEEKPNTNKQPLNSGYSFHTEQKNTHHFEQEGYRDPGLHRAPERTEEPVDRPYEGYKPKTTQHHPGPQPHGSTARPFQPAPPQYQPSQSPVRDSFSVDNMVNGVKKFVTNTFAPITVSATQSSTRQNRPQPPLPPQNQRPPRPWPQSNPPTAAEFSTLGNNEQPRIEVKNDFQKYYQPLAVNQPKFGDHIPKVENRKQVASPKDIADRQRRPGPNEKERRTQTYTEEIDFADGKDNKDWGSYDQQQPSKIPSDLRIISDIGQEYRGIVSKKQDEFGRNGAQLRGDLAKAPQFNEEARPKQSEDETPQGKRSKGQKKHPDNQNISQLSWASIFNNAESYESHEEPPGNDDFSSGLSPPFSFVDQVPSTKRPKTNKLVAPAITTTTANSVQADSEEENSEKQELDHEKATENSRIERLSSYKKRVESQREQARQRLRTTTTPTPDDDAVPETLSERPAEIQEPEVQKSRLDEESAKPESSTRVKFPQRTRVRSRTPAEKSTDKEAPADPEGNKAEVPEGDEQSSTTRTTTTTQSLRKTFDLNKYRSSNKFNFPKLRKRDEDTPATPDHEQIDVEKPQQNTPETSEDTIESPRSAEAGEFSRRRPGRKRMSGYRRRLSTTPESILEDTEQEVSPPTDEITESENDEKPKRKYIRKEFRPKISKLKERNEDEEAQKPEDKLPTSTESLKEVPPTTVAEDHLDRKDEETPTKTLDTADNHSEVKEEKEVAIAEESAETTAPSLTPSDTGDNGSVTDEKSVQPTPNASDEDLGVQIEAVDDVTNLKPETTSHETTSDFSTGAVTKAETITAAKNSEEIDTIGSTEADTAEKEKASTANQRDSGDSAKEASSEEIQRRNDLDSEATSVFSAPKEVSSEEKGGQAKDSSEEQDSHLVKHPKKKFHVVTLSPPYVTMATHDPILPIEELLPLLPRDNGRGM